MDAGRPIDDVEIMMEVYTDIYHTGILTKDCKNWDERPNVENPWENLHSHSMDGKLKMWRKQKQMENQTGFHGANAMLTEEL